MQNSGDNVFDGIPVATDEPSRFKRFLTSHDLSPHSRKALTLDMRKFARWFSTANAEPFAGDEVSPTAGHRPVNSADLVFAAAWLRG